MKFIKIVGPCSIWKTGIGWVTPIPEFILHSSKYIHLDDIFDIASKCITNSEELEKLKLSLTEKLHNKRS